MKQILFVACITMLLSSCNKIYYQVYDTKNNGMIEKESSLVYENEDCEISYNLWGEKGNFGFIFYNKTESDIFIILPQTFYIKNGVAYDYFKNREFGETKISTLAEESTTQMSLYGSVYSWGKWYDASITTSANKNKTRGTSLTLSRKEMAIVCIPAHSRKVIKEYTISNKIIKSCNEKQDYPQKKSIAALYTKDDTPLLFKNRIAYTFSKDGNNLKYIENEFWISGVTNYSLKSAVDKKEYKECDYDKTKIIRIFNMASPSKFYNSYQGLKEDYK